jgi:hypothetical protein
MRSRGLRAVTGTIGVTATLLAAACYAGCEAVPDIRFVTDDARSDSPVPRDALVDSGDGSVGQDAGPCGPLPEPGATCCGVEWCIGCDPAQCNECGQKCTQQAGLCCPTPGTVVCNKAKCN